MEDVNNLNKCAMFESSISEKAKIMDRIEKMVSYYINKYEKIIHQNKFGLVIDRFELVT